MSTTDRAAKAEIIQKFARKQSDTGSPEVHIALLTRRIESMTAHFSKFPKDLHSRRGMMRMIAHRKNLLAYLRREDVERYRSTLGALGLRK